MLRSNVAIAWPELANAGQAILRYVVMKCCDRLAGALQGLIHGRCCQRNSIITTFIFLRQIRLKTSRCLTQLTVPEKVKIC